MPRSLCCAVTLLAVLASSASASWQYLSRPDLHTPVLNITHSTPAALAPGYLFVAPFSGSSDQSADALPHQPGPYIYDARTGEVVWTGFAQYLAGWTVNLQKTRFNGADALLAFQGRHNAAHGHGHGHLTILDATYSPIATIGAGHHRLVDKHEGQLLGDGKTALVQIYHPVPVHSLSQLAGGPDSGTARQWVVDAQFQEVDVATGDVVFEWHSLDHVPVHHSNISLASGQAGSGTASTEAWDYFHINAVDKNEAGDYLISARDANSLYKINGTTGDIIWALGGRNQHNGAFKALDRHTAFSYQHHARFHGVDEAGRELVSLYDNSAHGTETAGGAVVRDAPTSSGKILAVDTRAWTVETVAAYYPPFALLSKSQGSTHVLPGGNVVVNWGSEGAVTEFAANGTVVWHAFLDSGATDGGRVQNYRAFKSEWTGRPREEPAVVGLLFPAKHRTHLVVAASWNGDTEVVTWRFAGRRNRNVAAVDLASEQRLGFETRANVELHEEEINEVQAIGLDGAGNELVQTRWEGVRRDSPVPPGYSLRDVVEEGPSAQGSLVLQN